jgi:mRNA-degrading endonuclease YafQ of YafQ-DinJ toxin-antitoxin module
MDTCHEVSWTEYCRLGQLIESNNTSRLLECDAVLGKLLVSLQLEKKVLQSLEMLGTAPGTRQCHIPKDLNLKHHRHENLRYCTVFKLYLKYKMYYLWYFGIVPFVLVGGNNRGQSTKSIHTGPEFQKNFYFKDASLVRCLTMLIHTY